jgi:XRCC1 N terminal domain
MSRKRLIDPTTERLRTLGHGWLDLERAAVVEVTSEDKDFPVESVFVSEDAQGWRAAAPGRQTIRLIFDHPQQLKCVNLAFEEDKTGRTQEFVLRWSSDGGRTLKEIVRQQWNFSPPESTREVEEYQVDLCNVNVLELVIKPDIRGGLARASLKNLRLY